MIVFAAFYIDIPSGVRDRIRKRVPIEPIKRPHQLTAMMLESARLFHPGCRTVVLSDRHTKFNPRASPFLKPFHPDTEIIRFELDQTRPMLARSTAWLEFLRQADTHVVFVDSDILFNANLDDVFEWNFDVALTYRDQEHWPINSGIGFVHRDNLARGIAFHEKWLELVQGTYADTADWGADQDAAQELLSEADFTRADAYLHRQNGFGVLLLPCADYNFSSASGTPMTGVYPDKKVLHFKGHRKPSMSAHWKRHLRSTNTLR